MVAGAVRSAIRYVIDRLAGGDESQRDHTARATRDHDEIRRWVEQRGGWPAAVKGTGGDGDAGLLRIDFPGYSGAGSLEPVSWEDFFETFDREGLYFLHQDRLASGEESRFFKFVDKP